jgi:hypothetical protein
MLLIWHVLGLSAHLIHASLATAHSKSAVPSSTHGLQSSPRPIKLLTAKTTRTALVMEHRHMWWLHLLRMLRWASMRTAR